jgi:branched-chain amino acid transport system permease protein
MFGGIGTVWGPVIGSAILVPLSEVLHARLGHQFPGIQGVIFGLAIVIVILVAPEGIYWRIRDAWRKRSGAGEMTAAVSESVTITPMETSRRAPPSGTEPIMRVRNLSKAYGGLKAVQDVSFDVARGSILGIIGPNGAGKTTLFNLLNGFVKPDKGSVTLGDSDIVGWKPHQICAAGVGRTFQIMRPFLRMSIADNVVVGAYVRARTDDEARAFANAAIARVGLTPIATRVASQLTTKELRLMEIARALAGGPQLLLLDETLAGLGQSEAVEVVSVVRRLADEGITIVIIEHTMHAMVRLVDRLVVLDHGAVLTEGAPEVVTRDPHVIEAYLGKKWRAAHADH